MFQVDGRALDGEWASLPRAYKYISKSFLKPIVSQLAGAGICYVCLNLYIGLSVCVLFSFLSIRARPIQSIDTHPRLDVAYHLGQSAQRISTLLCLFLIRLTAAMTSPNLQPCAHTHTHPVSFRLGEEAEWRTLSSLPIYSSITDTPADARRILDEVYSYLRRL